MAVKILIRRATAAEWTSADPTLAQGELGYETDTQKLKMGDGSTAWTSLSYAGATDPIVASAITARGQIFTGSDSTDYAVLSIGTSGQILIEDPVAGTLTYQSVTLDSLPGVNTTSATTGDLFARGASEWGMTTFSTELSGLPANYLKDTIANADMTKRTVVGLAGYFSQGFSTNVYKSSFPTDSISSTTSSPSSMSVNAGFANPAVAGYMNLGVMSANATVYKWAFPADTVTTTTSAPNGIVGNGGFSNPAVAGYFNRGNYTDVYKWTFPSDTVSSSTSAPLYMDQNSGFANPSVAGYFNRGLYTGTVYKWAFPSDSVSTTTSSAIEMNRNGGFANPAVAGYFKTWFASTNAAKWSFPTDSVSYFELGNLDRSAGFSNPSVCGYISYGNSSTNVYKVSFPTDALSTITFPSGLSNHAGFSNA